MRDYGNDAEAVWDSDPDCAHVWGKEITRRQSGGTSTGSVTNNSDDRIHFASKSKLCSRCGAWKGQLGLEPSFGLFIKHLCDIFDEVKRVLKKTGTCWVNMGETYATHASGSKNHSHNFYKVEDAVENAIGTWNKPKQHLAEKSLCQIPSRFAIEMCNRGWILRNEIIWHKPNCMPSSAKDRFTVDFDKVFFFVKNKRYWFEIQYEPWTDNNKHDLERAMHGHIQYDGKWKKAPKGLAFPESKISGNPLQGRNKRCVWKIPTQPFPKAHFAVYPEALIEIPVKAGCPQFICKKCEKAREKITRVEENYPALHRPVISNSILFGEYLKQKRLESGMSIKEISKCFPSKSGGITGIVSNWETGKMLPRPDDYMKLKRILNLDKRFDQLGLNYFGNPSSGSWVGKNDNSLIKGNRKQGISLTKKVHEIGYSDCGCNAGWRKGIVLDPFCGSGTTCVVAKKLGRNWIGIDINPDYCKMGRKRLAKVPLGRVQSDISDKSR